MTTPPLLPPAKDLALLRRRELEAGDGRPWESLIRCPRSARAWRAGAAKGAVGREPPPLKTGTLPPGHSARRLEARAARLCRAQPRPLRATTATITPRPRGVLASCSLFYSAAAPLTRPTAYGPTPRALPFPPFSRVLFWGGRGLRGRLSCLAPSARLPPRPPRFPRLLLLLLHHPFSPSLPLPPSHIPHATAAEARVVFVRVPLAFVSERCRLCLCFESLFHVSGLLPSLRCQLISRLASPVRLSPLTPVRTLRTTKKSTVSQVSFSGPE